MEEIRIKQQPDGSLDVWYANRWVRIGRLDLGYGRIAKTLPSIKVYHGCACSREDACRKVDD